jgi:hypothetical protein
LRPCGRGRHSRWLSLPLECIANIRRKCWPELSGTSKCSSVCQRSLRSENALNNLHSAPRLLPTTAKSLPRRPQRTRHVTELYRSEVVSPNSKRQFSALSQLKVRVQSFAGKGGAGTENAKHPSGRSGFRYLPPFSRQLDSCRNGSAFGLPRHYGVANGVFFRALARRTPNL